jgi:ABC-type branched-subunit amino acid transport system substrate-binding protein
MITRRSLLASSAGAAAALIGPRPARAGERLTVGLVLPPPSRASRALEEGAALGLDEANALATLFGKRLVVDARVAADGPAAAAEALALVRGGAIALIGGAGAGVAPALASAAASLPAVFLNAASGDEDLRNERCGSRVFHVVPSVSMGTDALGQWLVSQRRLRWAVLSDPSPRSRQIEAGFRRAATARGASLHPPDAPVDTLLVAGPEGVPEEAIPRARSRGQLVAGIGEEGLSGVSSVALRDATAALVVGWHHSLDRFSARELNARFRRRFQAPLTETSWAAWAAVRLVGEALVRGGATEAEGLAAFLRSGHAFDGHKGRSLTFRAWDRQLRQPLYVVDAGAGDTRPAPRGRPVLAEVPDRDLDGIGTPRSESRCRPRP